MTSVPFLFDSGTEKIAWTQKCDLPPFIGTHAKLEFHDHKPLEQVVYILETCYVLALLPGLEEKNVYIAIVAAESLMTLVAGHIFRHGRWKTREV